MNILREFSNRKHMRYMNLGREKTSLLLLILLLVVVILSFFIPLYVYGRLFGTDEYTHLFHAQEMYASNSLFDFYNKIGRKVSDPESEDNPYKYPFGIWLYGAIIAKVTGLLPYSTAYLLSAIFLIIILVTFYLYFGSFINSEDQILLAILFLLSMPTIALTLENFRPSVFVIPFLLLTLFFAFKEKLSFKSIVIMWISVFMIIIIHTGTFIFLISFSIVFFLAYILIWGRFSKSMYILVASTLFIYVITVNLFPDIYPQYADKSTLFLSPGNFLSSKLHLSLAKDLSEILYKNLFIQKEYAYAIFWSAFIYFLGVFLLYLHSRFFKIRVAPQILVLPQKISHSLAASPFWIGPFQTFFSAIGFFRLDSKSKCILLTAVVTTVFPQWLQESEGISGGTGALKEIYYLIIIIPIASALGFWYIISKLNNSTRVGTLTLSAVLIVVFTSLIVIPGIGNIYYLPQISGEDHVIGGMEWLSHFGTPDEKVVGYGYRTVPIYTNKVDAAYGLKSGTETRTFSKFLRNIHFANSEKDVQDFYSLYGVKYIITSSKSVSNLGGSPEKLNIDFNKALDRIYSTKDFRIYSVLTPSEVEKSEIYPNENFAIRKIGSSIKIESKTYKIFLDENSPTIRYIGTSRQNYLEEGMMYELVRISWLGGKKEFASYLFNDLLFSREIKNNQIIYKKVLQDENGSENWASLVAKYTFYPNTIKREYIISNDLLSFNEKVWMRIYFSTNLFSPFSELVLKNGPQRIEKKIYPSEDSVKINDLYEDIYLHDRDKGIYIKYDTTAPHPNSISYKGSTRYNYSSVSIGQFEFLEPGTSLHITQYISIGDEATARNRIEGQKSIALHLYPEGMVPIILCGYLDPILNRQDLNYSQNGYEIIKNNNIPYTEALDASQLDLRNIVNRGMNVIGYISTGGKYYDNINIQEYNIQTLIVSANNQNYILKGFMPASYNYNLDTIKVLRDKNVLYMIAIPINPPLEGFYDEGLRHPQIAQYKGNTTSLVLLPVSNPSSTYLSYTSDIFSSWKSVIDSAMENDDLVLFMWRSADIGNPEYTDSFIELIKYSKMRGLTFTTPDTIAEHYRKLQRISYNTHREIDVASISITNENDELVQGVTFKVKMPKLEEGSYTAKNGRIVKIKESTDQLIIYASTDVEPHESKVLIIEPDIERKHFNVELPKYPIEGQVLISVKDENDKPLPKATVIIDSTLYETNENGIVQVELRRGIHQVIVDRPGYARDVYELEVKGRIYLFRKFVDDIL